MKDKHTTADNNNNNKQGIIKRAAKLTKIVGERGGGMIRWEGNWEGYVM